MSTHDTSPIQNDPANVLQNNQQQVQKELKRTSNQQLEGGLQPDPKSRKKEGSFAEVQSQPLNENGGNPYEPPVLSQPQQEPPADNTAVARASSNQIVDKEKQENQRTTSTANVNDQPQNDPNGQK